MKYFDVIPPLVNEKLSERGVDTDSLLYCVKADLDGEGCYFDVYAAFSKEMLYVISGYEEFAEMPKKDRINERMRDIPVLKLFARGASCPTRSSTSRNIPYQG